MGHICGLKKSLLNTFYNIFKLKLSVILKLHSPSCSFEADETLADEPRELSNMKRHSEGTFSNDYSKYLEDRKAQDFVRWLMNNKRSGSVWDPFKTSAHESYCKKLSLVWPHLLKNE